MIISRSIHVAANGIILLLWLSNIPLLSKESACNAAAERDVVLILGSGRSPGEGNGNLLQFSCQEKSHGWRSLADPSPWGGKESDMTSMQHTLITHTHTYTHTHTHTHTRIHTHQQHLVCPFIYL